jgi:hypothetical protein
MSFPIQNDVLAEGTSRRIQGLVSSFSVRFKYTAVPAARKAAKLSPLVRDFAGEM